MVRGRVAPAERPRDAVVVSPAPSLVGPQCFVPITPRIDEFRELADGRGAGVDPERRHLYPPRRPLVVVRLGFILAAEHDLDRGAELQWACLADLCDDGATLQTALEQCRNHLDVFRVL